MLILLPRNFTPMYITQRNKYVGPQKDPYKMVIVVLFIISKNRNVRNVNQEENE